KTSLIQNGSASEMPQKRRVDLERNKLCSKQSLPDDMKTGPCMIPRRPEPETPAPQNWCPAGAKPDCHSIGEPNEAPSTDPQRTLETCNPARFEPSGTRCSATSTRSAGRYSSGGYSPRWRVSNPRGSRTGFAGQGQLRFRAQPEPARR